MPLFRTSGWGEGPHSWFIHFSSFLTIYHREGQGFILVYSIASRSTFDRLEIFHTLMRHVKRGDPIFMLVGNMCDKRPPRMWNYFLFTLYGRCDSCKVLNHHQGKRKMTKIVDAWLCSWTLSGYHYCFLDWVADLERINDRFQKSLKKISVKSIRIPDAKRAILLKHSCRFISSRIFWFLGLLQRLWGWVCPPP